MTDPAAQNQNAEPTYEELQAARDQLEENYLGAGANAHTFGIGEIEKDGKGTGQLGVIVFVEEKLNHAQLGPGQELPKALQAADGTIIPIDVQIAPQPKDLRLMLNDPAMVAQADALAGIADWRQCFNLPIPGGVQIAPDGAGWVGTLSGACTYLNPEGQRRVGFFTNYHVGVARRERGLRMGQPSGRSGGQHIGTLERWSDMQFSRTAQNRTDCAVFDSWREGGNYGSGCHTVKPEQFNLGKINPNPVLIPETRVGHAVVKSGRTTGRQQGKIVAVASTSHVGYDQGTARFVDQIVVRGDAGEFSGPGDSGSLVLTTDMRPIGLLFAGGGGTTIINPIQFVMEEFGIQFFGT